MIDIRPALRAFLLASSPIATMVGTRIYPVRLPQSQREASLVYNRISEQGDYHMQGASGLISARMQIDAWAVTQDAAVALANLVKGRMDTLRHTTISFGSNSPQDSIIVQGSFMEGVREDYDEGVILYRVGRDYVLWYEEV